MNDFFAREYHYYYYIIKQPPSLIIAGHFTSKTELGFLKTRFLLVSSDLSERLVLVRKCNVLSSLLTIFDI